MTKPTKETVSTPCNLCSSTSVQVINTKKPLRIVICQDCGLLRIDPFPHNPKKFYEEDYRIVYKGNYTPKAKHIFRAGKTALSRFQQISSLLSKSSTILDVGTGGGEFAYLLQHLGLKVTGIEPNKGYADYSRNEYELNIKTGFIQNTELAAKSFDIITLWHVLEHTENPYAILVKLRELLTQSGILIIEVPNIEAVCQSPKSTFHEAHLFYFNHKNLRKLAEKAGLKEKNSLTSPDGGNITLFLEKSELEVTGQDLKISTNCEHILECIQNHSTFKHYSGSTPYLRLYLRLCQALEEKLSTTGFTNGKSLLDQLYSKISLPSL